MSTSAVEITGVSKVFAARKGDISALTDIDLQVETGEFVSLIGPSGCGKSTLLRIIAGLIPSSAGRVTVNGKSAEQARRDQDYGFAFQQAGLLDWRSVAANVELPLVVHKVPRAERRARARELLELVGLGDFAEHRPAELSGGMQQRVSIARALAESPTLLLMDEPFGALDEITRDTLNLHLHRLWRQSGLTSVFVTHSIAEAVYLSSRIVVMSPRPGRIVEVIDVELGPAERPLEIRETPEFLAVANRVRSALRAGHSYD